MIKAIINGLLSLLMKVVDIVLTPLNLLFVNLFPDATQLISNFTNFVNRFFGNTLNYFFYIIPPITRNIIFYFFTFVIAYYSIYYTYLAIKKIFDIIQKIKLW